MNNFFDSGNKSFDQNRDLHVVYVNPALTVSLGPRMQGIFEVEGQFIYDMDRHDFNDDVDLRNAYLRAALPGLNWINFSMGQQALSTMGGLIYDDESPALRMKADLERGFDLPLKFDALITEVKYNSPYLNVDLRYCFSFLESVSFSYGWFRDTDDGVARIFNYLNEEKKYKSSGKIQWFGLSTKKFAGDVFLKSTFIYERGTTRLRQKQAGKDELQMRGYLFDITGEYSLNKKLSLGLFFYLASGDKRPARGALTSFVAIDPYVDKTNIFFNGGMGRDFSSDNVGLAGIHPSGVITPGVSLDYRVRENIFFKAVFAYLFTQKSSRGAGHTYGWEADFMGSYNLSKNFQLFSEVNFFNPGKYFKKLTGYRDNRASEITIGVNYLFNN
ncbi:MAG: hypothetical protein WCQ99_11140 [Pseudomonadota bacterium]